MRWIMKIQKIGRIQIPTAYLNAYEINEGDEVIIEEKDDRLILIFKKQEDKRIKKKD